MPHALEAPTRGLQGVLSLPLALALPRSEIARKGPCSSSEPVLCWLVLDLELNLVLEQGVHARILVSLCSTVSTCTALRQPPWPPLLELLPVQAQGARLLLVLGLMLGQGLGWLWC